MKKRYRPAVGFPAVRIATVTSGLRLIANQKATDLLENRNWNWEYLGAGEFLLVAIEDNGFPFERYAGPKANSRWLGPAVSIARKMKIPPNYNAWFRMVVLTPGQRIRCLLLEQHPVAKGSCSRRPIPQLPEPAPTDQTPEPVDILTEAIDDQAVAIEFLAEMARLKQEVARLKEENAELRQTLAAEQEKKTLREKFLKALGRGEEN